MGLLSYPARVYRADVNVQVRVLRALQYVAASATCVLVVASLVGWGTGSLVLTRGMTAYVSIAPLTAVILLLFAAVLFFRLRVAPPRGRWLVLAISGFAGVTVALEWLDMLTGLPVDPARILAGVGHLPLVRMSPVAAIGFLGLSASLGFFELRASRLRWAATVTSLLVAVGAFILLVGYAFGAPLLYGGNDTFAVALPAATGLLLLGIAIAAFGADCWPFTLFIGASTRAWLMRAVVPAALVPLLSFVLVDAVLFHWLGLSENPASMAALFLLIVVLVTSILLRATTRTGSLLDSAKRDMEESENLFRSMFSEAPLGIALVDSQTGMLHVVNRRFAEIAGRTQPEMAVTDWMGMTHPDDLQQDLDEAARFLSGEIPGYQMDKRYVRPDGSAVWVGMTIAPVDGPDQPRVRHLCMVEDITARKSAETELERRGVRLEQLLAERERNLNQLARALSSVIEVVSQVVEIRDPYTAGHQNRVAELSVCIAEELGMDARQIEEVRVAALLHDVGKMAIPAEILSKPGTLSPAEFALIKGHSEAGHRIMVASNMESSIAEIVYQHHERCDGSGYPRGLAGHAILQASKVIMVADVVEAMSSHRPYRPALGIERTIDEIKRGAGEQYDADVAAACQRVIEAGFAFSDY